jgi:hypothetical protein
MGWRGSKRGSKREGRKEGRKGRRGCVQGIEAGRWRQGEGVRESGWKRVDGSIDGRGGAWGRGQPRKEDEGEAQRARAVRGESSRERRGGDSR